MTEEFENFVFGVCLLLVAVSPAAPLSLLSENDSYFMYASAALAALAGLLALWQIYTLVSRGTHSSKAFKAMIPLLGLAVLTLLFAVMPEADKDEPLSIGEGAAVVAIILGTCLFAFWYLRM